LGAPKTLKKRGQAWDQIAVQLERIHDLAGLLAALEWIWSDLTDGFWAQQITERRKDPFEYFRDNIIEILDQHERMRLMVEKNSKRTTNSTTAKTKGDHHDNYDDHWDTTLLN
jgi:hypothetical protein